MHELSIATSILDVVGDEIKQHAATYARKIHVRLGPLSGVIEYALLGAFEYARESSPFPGAELVIESVPVMIQCPSCQEPRRVVSFRELCCVECGTFSLDIISGRELEITAMEIE